MARDLSYDPFVLAVGHVALVTPGMESALGNLCATLAEDEAERVTIQAAPWSFVRGRIDDFLAHVPDGDFRERTQATLSECDDAWAMRNAILHGLWSVNSEGF
ncbi:MAG: hypothetical protein ACR2KJ_07895 [Jatrophihabitans sp.]